MQQRNLDGHIYACSPPAAYASTRIAEPAAGDLASNAGLSTAVHGRAPVRRFQQQPLPASLLVAVDQLLKQRITDGPDWLSGISLACSVMRLEHAAMLCQAIAVSTPVSRACPERHHLLQVHAPTQAWRLCNFGRRAGIPRGCLCQSKLDTAAAMEAWRGAAYHHAHLRCVWGDSHQQG